MPANKILSSNEYTKLVYQLNEKLSMLFNQRRKEPASINNPFIYIWNIPWYQWIKMCILTLFLMPLRIIFFLLFFGMSLLFSLIATSTIQDDRPMHGWRKKIMLPIFIGMARTSFFFSGLQWIRVKGKRCSRNHTPILVLAPHSAFLDALIVVYLGMDSVVGKLQSSKSVVGSFLKMTQPVLVDRNDPDSRQKTIDEIGKRCNLLENWPQMLIFPEGTCTNRSSLIRFKTGAFFHGSAVQPVLIHWPNKIDNVAWTWEGPGIWTLLWMTFTQFHTNLEIEFLPAYIPNTVETKNPKLFAENVRLLMAKKLGIPTNNYSYEDCRHMTLAKQNGLPFSEIIVEFSRITQYLSLLYGGNEEMLIQLLLMIQNIKFKKMTYFDFCNTFNISDDMKIMVESTFIFYDDSKSGSIYLRDLVSHMALYCLPYDRKKGFFYAYKAFRETMYEDEFNTFKDTLKHTFMLNTNELNYLITFIQEQEENNFIDFDKIDEMMQIVSNPFNMYRNFFDQYNQSKRSKLPTSDNKTVETGKRNDEI